MFGVGAAITLIPMLVAAIVGRLVFKISLLDLLGTITGGMTILLMRLISKTFLRRSGTGF